MSYCVSKLFPFDITDLIKERIEVTARGNLRIQIAQSTCRGISRILQWFCCRFIVFFSWERRMIPSP